jgi:RND family efflux transporter MFP subunit
VSIASRGLRGGLTLLVLAAPAAARAELDCLIEPKSSVTVSSPIEGRIDAIVVERGDVVEKGQVVARLDARLERGTYEIAKARAASKGRMQAAEIRLEFAKRENERRLQLQERKVVSSREFDEAEEEKRQAEAMLVEAREARRVAELERDRAAANLELRTIVSPVSGIVVRRLIEPGEYADPPQILEVAEIDPLHVEVFVPLALVGRIELGSIATVLPEQPVGGSHEARVTVVDRVVDAASGTFGVRLELPNPDLAIPAGLNCQVRFPGVDP